MKKLTTTFAVCITLLAAACSSAPGEEEAGSSGEALTCRMGQTCATPPPGCGGCTPRGYEVCWYFLPNGQRFSYTVPCTPYLPPHPSCPAPPTPPSPPPAPPGQTCAGVNPTCGNAFHSLNSEEQSFVSQFGCTVTGIWSDTMSGATINETYALCPNTASLQCWIRSHVDDGFIAGVHTNINACDQCLPFAADGSVYVFWNEIETQPTCTGGCMGPSHW